jgi:branched-chain amino acid transport system ATP-binding protein
MTNPLRDDAVGDGVALPAPLLAVRGLNAWYGDAHVLHGVNFAVPEGEIVTLLGRNGAGKTTVLKSIIGLVPRREGSILLGNAELIALPSHRIAGLGVAYCPEERGIFTSLSVAENLHLPPRLRPGGLSEQQILDLFPNLAPRLQHRGDQLSGGEQQMLAIGRILRTGARLLLLDEPTEGLAPVVVREIGRTLCTLRQLGFTVLLVEQNFRFAAAVADRHYVIDHGAVATMFVAGEIVARRAEVHAYLGV